MSNEINKYQSDAQFQQSAQGDEIDLRELFSVIWQGKWLIIAITTVFAICSVVFALMQPNIYKSEALLAPTSEERSSGISTLAGQFGGLANMAGISLGGAKIDKSQMAMEVMKSRQFVSAFIQKHDILPELMAAKKWDISENKIIYDIEVYEPESSQWVRKVSTPFKVKPSMQEAYGVFREIFEVQLIKESGMVSVSVESVSPYIAQQWVTWLIEDINKEMKERDVEEATRGTAFLEQQLSQTNVADIRTILYQLMEEAAKTIMFANVREEYVFKTIDPALVPEVKSQPRRAMICILGTLSGGLLAVSIVLARFAFRKER